MWEWHCYGEERINESSDYDDTDEDSSDFKGDVDNKETNNSDSDSEHDRMSRSSTGDEEDEEESDNNSNDACKNDKDNDPPGALEDTRKDIHDLIEKMKNAGNDISEAKMSGK